MACDNQPVVVNQYFGLATPSLAVSARFAVIPFGFAVEQLDELL